MKYKKFIIKNYKGIKELVLDLSLYPDHNIFTFVGLNESGKTTILEAINFFQKDIPEDKRHILIPKSRKLNFNDSVSVRATFTLNKEDEEMIKEYATENNFIITEDIKELSVTKAYSYEDSEYRSIESLWTIPIIGRKKRARLVKRLSNKNPEWHMITTYIKEELFPSIIYYPNFLFDFPEKIYLEEFEGEKEEQDFYRRVLQDVLDSFKKGLSLNKHVLSRMKSDSEENKESLNSVLHKMSGVITTKVFKTWEELFKSKRREIIIKANTEDKNGTEARYYLEIKLKEGAEEYQISERSLGFKWFFAFLLFTEFRKNRLIDKGEILFLLDEPASNLHSTAQMKLISTFQQIVSKSKLIYTTHSHHLINPDWLAGAFIVKNKALDYENDFGYDSSKTDIAAIPYRQFVAQHPNQQTYFQPILDSLEYKPSKLELVPNIVIVEGRNDFYTFKYINEIILEGQFSSLNFYPGGGAGKNDRVIRLYISWGKSFIVLMDSDDGGKNGKKKYSQELGDIVDGKIFTLDDIEKGWKSIATENLFTETERIRIIKTLYPSAKQDSKTKFNRAIEHLLFFKNQITINETTKKKFIKIFEFLTKNLYESN
ncbi:MAG: ATP-binding protein [Patescibacteria group bacterium]|nr:ATP-binding protein [Patescibacteria group bacterium]